MDDNEKKEYFRPELCIDIFDFCDPILTSETGEGNKDENFPDDPHW